MKKVKIDIDFDKRKTANGEFMFRFGNGTEYTFTSKRDAQAFINESNETLTQIAYSLNFLLNLVEQEYRNVWGYFTHDKGTGDYKFLDRKIRQSLAAIDEQINGSTVRGSYLNGNYQVFSTLFKACRDMLEILVEIKNLHKNKSNAQQINQINYLITQINFCENGLKDLGRTNATGFFETVEIIPLPQLIIS